jgi:hypothetical protein
LVINICCDGVAATQASLALRPYIG